MNRRVFLFLAAAILPAALGACASGGAGSASGGNPDLLTREDLTPYLAQDVYSAIRRLRANWLNARGSQGTWVPAAGSALPTRAADAGEGQIQVYIDGTRAMTGLEALRDMSVELVREIRHLNSRDATMQYGTDHGAGAILVVTR
jgi:hypothetical protein